jgi:endo-1,4-beta-xylanase
LFFGTEVAAEALMKDAQYRQAVLTEADIIVAGYEMKWGQTEAKRGVHNYSKGDYIARFAEQNHLVMRGHTAIWHQNIPPWLEGALSEPNGCGLLSTRVNNIVSHYKSRIAEWDVLNEVIEPGDGRPDGLRDDLFMKACGRDYILDIFRAARDADPSAKRFYNDYGFEYDTDAEDLRRENVLKLLSNLRSERLVDGLGIQSHLKAGNRFNQSKFRAFLADVAGLGVEIVATEFDVNDSRLPKEFVERDQGIADHARIYLDTLLDERAVSGLVVWGVSSRYSFLNSGQMKRADGAPTRGLIYDENMKATPLRAEIVRAISSAPLRETK